MNKKIKNRKLVRILCLFLLFYCLLNHTVFDKSTPENLVEENYRTSLYKTTGAFLVGSGAATVLTVVCTVSSASTGVAPALYLLGGTVSGVGVLAKFAGELALIKVNEEQCKNRIEKEKKKRLKEKDLHER